MHFQNRDNEMLGNLLGRLVNLGTTSSRNLGINPVFDSESFGDQKGQVGYLLNCVFDYENRGLKRDGYFVDLACADGVTINNTFFLEKNLGWTGLLVEPNPDFRKSVVENRTSTLIDKVVSSRTGEILKFRVDNGMLGGVVSSEADNNFETRGNELKKAKIIDIQSVALADLFEQYDSPRVIDFMSLDVEGYEWEVLRDFPFDDYLFRSLVIERPSPELDLLLDSAGYRQVAHLNFDVFYVHADYLSEVNFAPKRVFKFTPRKNW